MKDLIYEGELDKRDERNISKIRWRRGDDGKYLSAFDTKEEAYRALKKLAKKYRHSDLHTNSVAELCRKYQDAGIMFYASQVTKWLPRVFNIDVKYTGTPPQDKVTTTMRLDRELKHEYLDALTGDDVTQHKRSWFINALLKKHVGMPSEEVLVFFEGKRINPETLQAEPQTISGLFFEENDEVRCLYFGKLETETKKIVELLAQVGEDEGLPQLAGRAHRLGYYVIQ